MATLKLTKSAVDKLLHPEKGQVLYLDKELKGFGLCVGAKSKTYFAQKDIAGRTVRVTIGKHGAFSCEEARADARERLVEMARGINPNQIKKENKVKGLTLDSAFKIYCEQTDRVLKKRSLYNYTECLNLYFDGFLVGEVGCPSSFISLSTCE